MFSFETIVPAKVVLAGEHSVIRGGKAIVTPFSDYSLRLSAMESREKNSLFRIFSKDAATHESLMRLRPLLEPRLEALSFPVEVDVRSTIPQGAGLGSSAALCVALADCLIALEVAHFDERLEFATSLENVFHGESSGMDVAAVAGDVPILFHQGVVEPLPEAVLPLRLIDSGLRAQTSRAVEQVKIHLTTLDGFDPIDQQMQQASSLALAGIEFLSQGEENLGLSRLRESFDVSFDCFVKWGLVPTEMKELRHEVLLSGALAVRVIGAGLGGNAPGA